MSLNFKAINIASQKDFDELKIEWRTFFEETTPFEPIQDTLSSLQVIVGFGEGFWGGAEDFFYLVYHLPTDRFYWYVRDPETDSSIFFYEIDPSDPIFNLLQTKSIEAHFEEYDHVLNYNRLYTMSREHLSADLPQKPIPLHTLFGEDSLELRIALRYFLPGGDTRYPHRTFYKKVFRLLKEKEQECESIRLNELPNKVYRKGNELFIEFGEGKYHYQLKKME